MLDVEHTLNAALFVVEEEQGMEHWGGFVPPMNNLLVGDKYHDVVPDHLHSRYAEMIEPLTHYHSYLLTLDDDSLVSYQSYRRLRLECADTDDPTLQFVVDNYNKIRHETVPCIGAERVLYDIIKPWSHGNPGGLYRLVSEAGVWSASTFPREFADAVKFVAQYKDTGWNTNLTDHYPALIKETMLTDIVLNGRLANFVNGVVNTPVGYKLGYAIDGIQEI